MELEPADISVMAGPHTAEACSHAIAGGSHNHMVHGIRQVDLDSVRRTVQVYLAKP